MGPRSLGFQTDIAILQAGGSVVESRGDYLVVRSPHNRTFWWGNFLLLAGAPSPDAADFWLDRFAAEFPEAGHVALGVDGTHDQGSELRCFVERGLDLVASTVMTATEVRAPRRPNRGAVCRQLCSTEDWEQSVELHIRCEDRDFEPIAYRAFASAKAATNRQITEAGNGGWFGAFADDRLVAQMGLITVPPGFARFQTVETDPDYRRRGLAATLVHHASQRGLGQMGAHILVMVADPDYFAIDLYRSLGFRAAETQFQVEKPPLYGSVSG